jgi:hypothetical protein
LYQVENFSTISFKKKDYKIKKLVAFFIKFLKVLSIYTKLRSVTEI